MDDINDVEGKTETPAEIEAPATKNGVALPVVSRPAKARTWKTKVKRAFLIGFLSLLLLIIVGSITGYWYVQSELPQVSGTLNVHGLEKAVSVQRDQWGTPHIKGNSFHDLFFAQGYTTAQDRLFQMEMNRWVYQGRLAEVFDASLLDSDIFMCTLDIYGASKAELPTLDEQNRQELQAYSDGVNTYIKDHQNNLPLEFHLLGASAENWTPLDSLAYGRLVALSLDNNWYYKYTRAMMIKAIGVDKTNVMIPAYPKANPVLLQAPGQAAPLSASQSRNAPSMDTAAATDIDLKQIDNLAPDFPLGSLATKELLGNMSTSFGSNNWVVDGTKTASGKPLLANDPHLGTQMPGTWYQVALQGPGLNVIGFSFPGVPGVILGHNDHIAWGVTNTEVDNTDLYMETLDSTSHPTRYKYNGQWLPLTFRKETFRIRGSDEKKVVTFMATQHGPLLNQGVTALKQYAPISLKWTALQPTYNFQGFFKLGFAQNWDQFSTALEHVSISQNFVYADTDGNIGYRMSGLLPIRPAENGQLPVDGSNPKYDWKGYVPEAQMPALFNPGTHIIATANNPIVPDNYPVYVTAQADSGYRVQRIIDLLQAKNALTAQDFKTIQADDYSIPAAQLTPLLMEKGKNASGDAKTALQLLRGWNYQLDKNSAAAAVYEATAGMLIRDTYEPLLGSTLYRLYRSAYQTPTLLQSMIALLSTDTASESIPAPDEKAVTIALKEGMEQLKSQMGDDTNQWSWGKVHQLSFDHPLAQVFPLNYVFGVPKLARPGDDTTINIGSAPGFSAHQPHYEQYSLSSMRAIYDASHLDASWWSIPVGQSGQFNSSHYHDQMTSWDQGTYQQMSLAENGMKDSLELAPAH